MLGPACEFSLEPLHAVAVASLSAKPSPSPVNALPRSLGRGHRKQLMAEADSFFVVVCP